MDCFFLKTRSACLALGLMYIKYCTLDFNFQVFTDSPVIYKFMYKMKLLTLFIHILPFIFILICISHGFPPVEECPEKEDTSYKGHCPPLLISENVEISCQDTDGYISTHSCSRGGKLGTRAHLSCKPFYESISNRKEAIMNCNHIGNWFPYRALECKLECGEFKSKSGLISHGSRVDTKNAWPWHGSLFKLNPKEMDLYEYICGVTLLGVSTALTAGHCTPSEIKNASEFRVVFGAKSSHFNEIIVWESEAQIFSVKRVITHPSFHPGSFDADIALLELDKDVKFNDNIKPVCFSADPNLRSYHLSHGSSGYVVGYGATEAGESPSKYLNAAEIPYVSKNICAKVQGSLPLHSQYCAGYLNGTSICRGDSGGGMYFKGIGSGYEEKFYIQGIVSHSQNENKPCSRNSYTVFTTVGLYSDWIEKVMDEMEHHQQNLKALKCNGNSKVTTPRSTRTTSTVQSLTNPIKLEDDPNDVSFCAVNLFGYFEYKIIGNDSEDLLKVPSFKLGANCRDYSITKLNLENIEFSGVKLVQFLQNNIFSNLHQIHIKNVNLTDLFKGRVRLNKLEKFTFVEHRGMPLFRINMNLDKGFPMSEMDLKSLLFFDKGPNTWSLNDLWNLRVEIDLVFYDFINLQMKQDAKIFKSSFPVAEGIMRGIRSNLEHLALSDIEVDLGFQRAIWSKVKSLILNRIQMNFTQFEADILPNLRNIEYLKVQFSYGKKANTIRISNIPTSVRRLHLENFHVALPQEGPPKNPQEFEEFYILNSSLHPYNNSIAHLYFNPKKFVNHNKVFNPNHDLLKSILGTDVEWIWMQGFPRKANLRRNSETEVEIEWFLDAVGLSKRAREFLLERSNSSGIWRGTDEIPDNLQRILYYGDFIYN